MTQWADQSGNANHAIPAVGSVLYPSASLSALGLAGLDFGLAANSLQLFSSASSQSWLDFNGAASTNSGFAVLVAFKCDELLTNNWNDVIGNASTTAAGFGLRYNQSGAIQAFLGGAVVDRAFSPVQIGNTVVFALNYDAVAGAYSFWDSKNGSEITKAVAKTNFSKVTAVTLGRTDNPARYMKGMVGEVKVFRAKLSSEAFQSERNALVAKWIAPQSVTTYPLTVNNGSGSGVYGAGSNVVIAAGAAPTNQVFDAWVINTGSVIIANTNAATTTLTMGTTAATVTATYKAILPPPSGYERWAATNSVGVATADDDDDGRPNLLEYAIGGNPKAVGDSDPVIVPVGQTLNYSYTQRNDDPGLTYVLQGCTDLFSPVWSNVNTIVITNRTLGEFDEVTRPIPTTESHLYIRLQVNQQ